MTDQEVQLFLADLAIIILLARLLGMAGGASSRPTLSRGAPGAVAARWTPGEGGAAAVLVAAQLAVADRLKLVISPPGGRSAS